MEVPIKIYQSDYLHWRLSTHSAFTTKSAWNEIRSHQPVQQFYKSLWSKLLILNISVFAWRLIHNWIPVDERLKEKGITLASKCLCCEDTETIPHLFLHNVQSLEAWGFFASKFQVNIPHTNDIKILIQSWKPDLAQNRILEMSSRYSSFGIFGTSGTNQNTSEWHSKLAPLSARP
ncbi:UNVERIFIED_CONTAM: hypothetical protein Sradi_7062400 [Sesamum radiatum]|uniref:Reverse transcriptase zinc-binding domain-containing protein n=1 Tax=Sesamum radiatum TaxID=300843 RepID=A0AAW2J6F5_SESRA